MRARARVTIDGKVKCSYCLKVYKPILDMPDHDDNRTINKIYPDAERWEKEQIETGLCSERCWDKYLGVQGNNTYDDTGRRIVNES